MADGDEERSFGSVEEEMDYWKHRAMEYRQSLEEVRNEYDDFQESSRELEVELEAQLEQAESKNRELLSSLQRLEMENEIMKNKMDAQQSESYVSITTLQEERTELLALNESMQKYIRELEQSNDDLERGKRVTMSSLEDFETRLNHAFERNALLENELDEKERLSVMCQRLKDEVRDLRSEITTKEKVPIGMNNPQPVAENSEDPVPPPTTSLPGGQSPSAGGNIGPTSSLIKTNATPEGTPLHTTFSGTQNFTPSTRISALNMVGDLLRKVGALESRLASCRTHISKDSMRHPRTVSPVDAPRVKRMHMQKYNGGETPAHMTKITV